MESMKAMADSGRCVISVIHQPRSSIYEMFDRLLILSEGNTMFYGKAKAAVGYFEGLGHRCPSNFNPPDFFLDLLSPDNRSPESEEESRNRIQSLSVEWRKFEDQNQSMLLKSESLDQIIFSVFFALIIGGIYSNIGLAISAFAPTVDVANAIGPPMVIVGILFGGFYISVDSLPVVAEWIPYLSML
eukprot:gene27369-35996_t